MRRTCQHNLAGHENEQHHLWILHSVDQTWQMRTHQYRYTDDTKKADRQDHESSQKQRNDSRAVKRRHVIFVQQDPPGKSSGSYCAPAQRKAWSDKYQEHNV